MSLIYRTLTKTLQQSAEKFPIVTVLGPRQSGKTTLVQSVFPDKPYLSLEDPDTQQWVKEDPRLFFEQYPDGAIVDEVQHVPELLSYMQTAVDTKKQVGQFILTGSQNLLLMEKVTQSLAGRTAILKLLPLSIAELIQAKKLGSQLDIVAWTGGYPRVYQKNIPPPQWYASYIETYVNRDVRLLKHINDLSQFYTFVQLCAARVGQLVNYSSLAIEAGISHTTAAAWLSILEASFILYRLQPHHINFNKQLVKSPKIYFYDTGLLCALLGIDSSQQLTTHYLRGNIIENLIMNESMKYFLHNGLPPRMWFWRDKTGHEIDLLLEIAGKRIACEIKSGQTIRSDFFTHLLYWQKLAGASEKDCWLFYGGTQSQKHSSAHVFGWKQSWAELLDKK